MSTVYVTYYVPAASIAAAGQAIASYLVSPGGVFTRPLVPFPGLANLAPTHFGGNAGMSDTGQLYAAIPGLIAAFPGSNYLVTPVDQWNSQWINWLSANGLQPQML